MALTREQLLTAVSCSALGLWWVAPAARAGGGATLPVPCLPSSCGASGPNSWVTSGAATATETGNQLTIHQSTNQATLNWSSFNVSADGKVIFQQPGATSIALNRIFQASPSTIYGTIQANGQIYLVNPNGMVFGKTASVNAAGILASTLGISDTVFQEGIVSPALIQNQQPALASDGRTAVLDQNGNPVPGPNGQPIPIQLSVQPGAQLSTSGSGGRILLASQNVSNAGTLTANGGQVILAAGSSVFLIGSTDPSLRGLLVEVDQGGTAWNQLQGQISAPTGNVTLVGLAVNQDGRVSATTTVSANGSITLQAQDTALFSGTGPPTAQRAGTTTLGPGSVTEVLPELSDSATAVADQTQLQSNITISGEQVYFQSNSRVVAPSGNLNVTAQANPSLPDPAPDPNARIRIDPGAVIDLAGSVATLPMSANELNVQLNAVELADDPLQRGGLLHGQTVTIDTRVGTPLANVSADIAAIPENIAQRTEAGGTATFQSAGDIVAASGATINVSGGYTNYQGGTITTTELVQANGTIVNIGNASPGQIYTGIVNPTYTVLSNTWGTITKIPGISTGHYEPGYQQGASAGSLDFAAPSMVLNGSLLGSVVAGPYQRTPATEPSGGQLILGLPSPLTSPTSGVVDDYRLPSVTFVAATPQIAISDNTPLPQGLTLQLPTAYLGNGFTSTNIYSNGSIDVAAGAPLNMPQGSTLALRGNDIEINSNITAAGGTLLFDAIQTAGVNYIQGAPPGVHIGGGVTLDVRGSWTNDQLLPWELQPTSEANVNGGSITAELSVSALTGVGTPQLTVGSGVQFELSGGAWLQRNGQLVYGSGGSLKLISDGVGNQFLIGSEVGLDAFGAGTAPGGALTLEADQIAIAPLAQGWESGITQPTAPLTISPTLFSDHGLTQLTLVANGAPSGGASNTLSVRPDTAIDAVAASWLLAPGYQNQLSAADVMSLGAAQLLPEAERTPMAVTLSSAPTTYASTLQAAGLSLPAGASLSGDPGAAFTLEGAGAIDIGGSIEAPGGSVSLEIIKPPLGATQDPGFLPGLALTLEPTAVIDVAGTTVLQPGNPVLRLGSVLNGGSISLIASRGSVDVLAGATVNVSGSQGQLDLPGPQNRGYVLTEVASAGGSVLVDSPDSINWLGTLEASAGRGTGAPVSGGSLTVVLDPTTNGAVGFPTGVRTVEVVGGAGPSALAPATATQAQIGTKLWSSSGIATLALESTSGVIEFDPGVNLSLGRELDLVGPLVEVTGSTGTARVSAPYVQISNPLANIAASTSGAGILDVTAHFIDLVGSTVFSGLGSLNLTSSGDVRLTSINLNGTIAGSLTTAGNLSIDSERLYPSTGSIFVLSASGTDSTLSIGQTGGSPGDPLSVNGAVTLSAPIIQDAGTVLAPFGSITMSASQSLTLAPGSLTSVSGDKNLFLFGQVIDGQWFYEGGGETLAVTGAPGRNVQLQSPIVSIAKGATVNISGGGDLYTYEWTPGTGGTQDQLSASVNSNLFAILPSLAGQLAPFDPGLNSSATPSAGMSVYLSGVPGLPAGVYPLLPARYALLPGAFLVSAVPGSNGTAAGVVTTQPDGATVVGGHYIVPGTQLASAETVGFAVQPGSYAFQLADYTTFTGTNFLTSAASSPASGAALPASAGTLILDVSQALNAAGSVLTSAAPGGQGALIEVEAPILEITGSEAANPGAVHVSGGVLQSWDPARLVLGGVVSANAPVNGSPPATPSTLSVAANTVTVDSGASLNLDDITLVAASSIVVQSGAELATPAPATALVPTPTAVSISAPQAALLELSSISYETPVRGGSSAAPPGTITLAPGASVHTNGSAVIDAPGGATLDGALSGKGTVWSLGASEIDFASSEQPGTLTVTPGLQSVLEQGAALRLIANTIVLDTPVDLAPAKGGGLQSLTIETAEINNASTGNSSLSAANIVFGNPFAAAAASTATNSGTLQFSGHEVTVGSGTLAFAGFSLAEVLASEDLTFSGTAGLNASGDLTVGANRVLAASNANGSLQSAGTLNVVGSGAATHAATSEAPVGGALTMQANTVNISGTVLLPSGNVTVDATEALNIQSGALLSVAGESVTAAGRTLVSGGGTLSLNSGGTFSAAPGATLAVNSAGADAGSIVITATGAAQMGATLAGQGGNGGGFQLSAASLDNFAALNAQLQSGDFNWQRSIDVGSGDLVLPAGEDLTAHQVRLVAESGAVQIGGTITAPSGASASSIELYGATGVTLLSGGSLIADAAGGAARGGNLTLGTTTGAIDLQPGSLISARGSSQPGTLLLRAPATGNDVAITELASNTAGLATVVIEPVETFSISGTPSDADFANIFTQVSAYASTAMPQISARLQPTSAGTSLIVEPGIELDTPGDVTLGSLDLSTWRFGGEPGILTVRAGGNVTINGTISDGFTNTFGDNGPLVAPLPGLSSTIQIVAGARSGSPDPLATVAGTAADLTLASGSIVRSGTGNLQLVAAQDLVFQPGASVYTGGQIAAPAIEEFPGGTANFLTSGGDLTLTAGRDVVGSFVVSSPADWQVRGLADLNTNGGGTFWGPDPTLFAWNAGTLGGGQMQVSAGRDVLNLSVAAADSGAANNGVLTVYGGGSLSVSAGRDIDTGYFYIADGTGTITAGGALGSATNNNIGQPLGTMLIAGSALISVQARGNVALEGVLNQTAIAQPNAGETSTFFTYGDSSAFDITSSGGSVQLASGANALAFLGAAAATQTNIDVPSIFPSTLQVRAFGGDIDMQKAVIYLYPAPGGQLDLFAAGNISGGTVVQSDAVLSSVPTPVSASTSIPNGIALPAQGAIHQSDLIPAEVTAGLGLLDSTIETAKAVNIAVGGNMSNTTIVAQNLRPDDVTAIQVGGNLTYTQSTSGEISVGGPGSLFIAAGGAVNLGIANGISTTGRLGDPQIPSSTGANVTVLAGLGTQGADVGNFISKIVAPSSTYSSELEALVTPAGSGAPPSLSAAVKLFDQLSFAQQMQFVDGVFFDELVQAGRLANSQPGSDFARGYAAIDALFPGSRGSGSTYAGDLTLDFSRIYTLQGGDISLLVPGGGVDVGLAVPPVGPHVIRTPSQLGIVTQQSGNVSIFSADDILVNSSRVFTLGGGNIAIWSTTGNIDAGRGAKASVSAPPPLVVVDALGNITLDFSGAVAGSGIRTIVTGSGQTPGNVDLIAPVGFVNAGDAGIGSAGNLNIAARAVLGTQNISVGGVATGVPPEVSGIGAALSGAAAAGASASNASSSAATAEQSAANAVAASTTALSWLDVFVLGLGEENCDPKDMECIKRQKPADAPH